MDEQPALYTVYKGLTRSAIVLGVPMVPLLFMTMGVAVIALTISIFWWVLWPILAFIMAQITKYDDQAFRILGLWIDTKVLNGNKKFWGASTYSPIKYKKQKVK